LVLQALRSTSAFAVPKAELVGQGLRLVAADDPKRDADTVRYVLAGAEVNQAVWVLHGRGDAGAFSEENWKALPDAMRSQLQVFHESRPLLRALLSMRADLAPDVKGPAEDVLLRLHEDPEGQEILAQTTGITRFERLTPKDRADLRQWESVLRAVGSDR
jgi:phosphonate transport system substrate-binding protein